MKTVNCFLGAVKRAVSMLLSQALIFLSCNRIGGDLSGQMVQDSYVSHDMIVLGDRLQDPYSVENMTKAVQSLYSTKASRVELTPTDLYVRFLPGSQEELDLLENLNFDRLDHPLDFQIVKEGDYYHDPTLPDDAITWQYCVVPPDFDLSGLGIRYEQIHGCYIPEHDVAVGTKAEMSFVDWGAVEQESFRLTGNERMLCSATKASSGRPSGRIAILDDLYDTEAVGVAGVKVNCNTFVKFSNAYTDDNGYYQMETNFSSNPRYRLIFHNKKGFTLGFNLLLVQASVSTLGRQSPSGVSIVVDKSSDARIFNRCVVNNAGYDYYESCTENGRKMKAPPANLRMWIMPKMSRSIPLMMQHGVLIDDTVVGQFFGEYLPVAKLFLPDVILGLDGCSGYDQVYAAAIHEFAHASHFMQVGQSWWTSYVKGMFASFASSGGIWYGVGTESSRGYIELAEMWAFYVQTALYRERYSETSASFGTSYWFSPQILLYLDERGMGRFDLFSGFSSDITSLETLQDRLSALYPSFKSVIMQAFSRYN